ncbi:MAG: hypothetical protein ACJ798_02330 [Phenylobacterium sp.]
MAGLKLDISPRQAVRAVAAAGLLVILGVNLPGHLSYDSVAQLYEGHFHVRETWGPALYAWVLGFFDQFIPGTSLYVTVSGAIFFASLASLTDLRPRTRWAAPLVLALLLLTPQLLIYQGIVWKDVMFANCAVASTICIAHAAKDWDDARRRWTLLLIALVLMAAGTQVRQNGIIAGLFAAIAVGWIGAGGRWRRGAVWGVGAFAALLVTGWAETKLSEPAKAPKDTATSTGVHIVQTYDVIGAAALDPTYRLDILAAQDPAAAEMVRERGKLDWSGRRVDFLDRDTAIQGPINSLPDRAWSRQWLDLVFKHPALYLRVRWEDFRWVFAPPVIDWCLPVYVGVDAPVEKMAPLGLRHRFVQSDAELNNYASWFLGTPVLAHSAYAAICLILGGLFLWRRDPADIPMAGLQLAGAAFAASFFIISIACDYRYMYFTDLAAMAGLVYAAVDPPTPWRRRI